ncbi:CheY-like superfamily [Penicillium expansum]|uniref:CheY-like superfamily n=1 Tax=Penicillium expansum TaxID=27334 RepID=A0A0A2JMC4_PENEN|nr:CheY-like superfamily [Penicillium expansum]KGO56534.1 CheY-like superfamily [Penicillium expansum]KGO64353.1 CheY-like superfamily [Penicillium expansum]
MTGSMYSPVLETSRIFSELCEQSERFDLPPEVLANKDRVSFSTSHNEIYFPIPFKETETLAALKGVEGSVAAAIADLRFGAGTEPRGIQVNLEAATAFGCQAYMAKVDGLSKLDPTVKSKLKNTDLLAAQSNGYRRMSANLYKTKNPDEYFHIHGSLEATTTLNMVGLEGQRPDLTDYEEIIKVIESKVQQYTAVELEEMNKERSQAGVTAYKHEDFIKTPHGKLNVEEPAWKVSKLPGDLPPTPFPARRNGSKKILEGVKVLEMCRIIAGPTVTRILAEYGADVLKITSPNLSDVPFFQVDGNMGKLAADLDLKSEAGRKEFEKLLDDVDVIVDGYRPGALDKLGYGAEAMAELAKKRGKGIVYVNENCFGYEGEWAGRAGWQQIADCVTGIAWAQGQFMGLSTPVVPPFPISDYGTGCMGAIAALTGLYHRAKTGGSYHGKASLMHYDLLLFAMGQYPADVQEELRKVQPPEFFKLRHCDSVDRISSTVLKGMKERFPHLYKPAGSESEGRKPLTELWSSRAYDADIEIVKPVAVIGGVDNQFVRSSRPNGFDRAAWEEFSVEETDVKKFPPETPSPRLSNDTTLTALTQLGVYRFGCNRSFVSIIDGESQHIISEATASISLRNKDLHRPDDGIFLGVNTLDLEWGVCPHAIRLFTGQDPSRILDTENITANQTRNIIRDFTKEDFYKDRPYVLGWPYFRFYAEVPLYSPSGFVLGSYCVVDNKPRTEFGDEDVAALREIADSISNHLENARIVQYHRRSENLVKGLTNFVKSHSKFDPTSSSTQGQIEASAKKLNSEDLGAIATPGDVGGTLNSLSAEKDIGVYSHLDQKSSTSLSGKEASIFSRNIPSVSNYTQPSSLSRTSDRAEPLYSSVEGPPESLVPDNVPITERIAAIFSRASLLLKESLDLDGVVFLDAHRNDPQFETSERPDDWDALTNFETGAPIASRSSPWGLPNENSRKDGEKYCGSLGQAISCRPAKSNTDSKCHVQVTEELLHSLITHFPDGHIFNIDSRSNLDNSVDSDSGNSEISALNFAIARRMSHHIFNQFPEANCVLFYPLWDWNKARWLAGTLVWVNGNHRPLGTEDLHYFKAFGDSMISEVSRIHWTASENSKFDFVTSISHELRSPLHGILASAELLHDIPLQTPQRDMVNMISTSGLTLLDTIDHLLDYCKINNLAITQSPSVTNTEDSGATLVSDFNLDSLVEQVAMILHTGRKAPGPVSSLARETAIATPSFQPASRVTQNEHELSVIVNIDQSSSWNIRSFAGAWRRIVMNLLGNAMKWTQTGLVEVSLSQATGKTKAEPDLVHLRVTDTGQGISQEFLRNSAFSPFAQEDPLSEGVGLGLSVVHKLVTFLGGDLKMKSESGVGTQVDVYVPAQRPKDYAPAKLFDDASSLGIQRYKDNLKACLIGFNGYPDLKETPTGILSSDAKRKLSIQSTLSNVFKVQLGWHSTLAESLDKGEGDIAVIEEAKFTAMLNNQSPSTTNAGHHFKFFIVLGSTTPSLGYSLPLNAILMSQPYGPQKICETAQRIMDLYNSQALIGGLEAPIIDPPTNHEILPSNPTAPSLPEVRQSLSQKPPIELVCPSPIIGGSPIRPNGQMNDIHVLIVDDNDINLKILATFMRKLGYSYDTASNGLIALEHVENSSRRYDLILMVSTSKIRQHEKDHGLQPSRIMAVTGVASDTMQQAAVTAGVDDYLVKPLSLRKLKKLIEPTL